VTISCAHAAPQIVKRGLLARVFGLKQRIWVHLLLLLVYVLGVIKE